MKGQFFVSFCLSSALLVVCTPYAAFAKNRPSTSQTKAPSKPLPLGQQLTRADDKSAEILIKKALAFSPDSAVLNFRLALALKKRPNAGLSALMLKFLDSPLGSNNALMLKFFDDLPLPEQGFLAQELSKRGVLEKKLKSSCPFFELEERQSRGRLLSLMGKDGLLEEESRRKIWREQYLELPETLSLESLSKDDAFKNWRSSLSLEDFLLRINNLLLFGRNLEAKESYELALGVLQKLSEKEQCALDYEGAKIERKMRHYQEARKRFLALSNRCDDEVKQKSRYMDLQLAAMAGDKKSLAQFDSFVADYPTHGFSDDVLLFKATILLDDDDKDQALATLDQLINNYPKGDMIERALFLKAFTLAKMGKSDQAILDLKKLKATAAPGSLERDQAHYWIARLSIFSDLKIIKTKKNQSAAKRELMALAKSQTPTVYSWLAFKLLEEMGAKPHLATVKKSTIAKKISPKTTSLQYIHQLTEQGFIEEALALLNEENINSDDGDQILAVAQLYMALGEPQAGHQKLIRCNAKIASTLKKLAPRIHDEISWPKPFGAQVREASSRLKVPTILINSVIRQESGFLAKALSWAQARGPMQLVESTANEHAKLLGLAKVAPEDLFDPELNILLGSSALNKYSQNFGHVALALSAYNAGPTSARKWQMAHKGLPVDTFIEEIPFKETRAYVKAVIGGALNYAIRDGAKLFVGDFRLAAQ